MAVNSSLVQIYYLYPNIIYAAWKDRLITLLNQAVRRLWTKHLHEVSPQDIPPALSTGLQVLKTRYNPVTWSPGAKGATCNLREYRNLECRTVVVCSEGFGYGKCIVLNSIMHRGFSLYALTP